MSLVDEQQLPTPNGMPNLWQLVINDMRARDEVGTERYGTPLQPFNGRKALVDLYQELLDAVVYTRQRIYEEAHEGSGALKTTHSDSGFIGAYRKRLDAMSEIVLSRDREGRNAETSPSEQFNGVTAVLDMVYMKVQRARSYYKVGNWAKFEEELLDGGNYCLFAMVFAEEEQDGQQEG